ncbi:uncharacterized protein LOC128388591 [Panonychus citri]|uniref:uncharacterized protein LOC128388591 n=1 Tax=Panonychus citri TaxID=50023 RepID=UPI002307119F|nr:uncharacterized protein LOC128388591 [Panonychus citri]XP_053203992.1 uncharacterized protein LOC128388591 [Panonychus citri]
MNFFKKFYLPSSKPLSENGSGGDCENGEVGEEEIDSNRDICSPFKRTFLSPTLFVDSSAANDYVCKICHFMAVDPLEHVPGPNVTCSNIFCLPCVKTYSTSGLASCPAEGCLTSGFDWSSLRELGTREIARLSNLMLNCEFKCSQVIPYRDYWTHREKCPANPDNFCEICDSPKTCDTHSCREVFIQLKKKDETLVKENNQLKAEIDKLRRELDSLRGERAEKMSNGISSTTTYTPENQSNHSNDNNSDSNTPNTPTTSSGAGTVSTTSEDKNAIKSSQRTKVGPPKVNGNKNGKPDNNNNTNSQHNYNRDNWDSKSSSSHNNKGIRESEETGFLRGAVPQYKFHSNCFMIKSDHSRIRLIFHYGEKSYKIDDAQSTFTFRTLRSLLHDMMKHDPGIMLLVRHRILDDRETISSCGFKPGLNSISLVPYDTPDFNEPGFRLGLYRLKHATDPLDAKKVPPGTIKPNDLPFISKEAIDFYSNSLDPQIGEKDITLSFHKGGKDDSLEIKVKRDQTIGSIRSMVDYMIEGGCGKMMHITHQLIRDDMTVRQYGIGFGTVDITLLPASFPIDLDKTRTLHLIRFRNNGKMSKKFTGKLKSRTNSMASLVL